MLNKEGGPKQGLLVDSRYYNFVMARKILFFITFFSRYLVKIYSYTKKKQFSKSKTANKVYWRYLQWAEHREKLAYLFTVRFKRYYSRRREYMFILALNKFLWNEVLFPLQNEKVRKVSHSYGNVESFDFRVFLMMVEIFHRVIISTAMNYNSTYSIYPIWKFNTLNVRIKKVYYLLLRYYYTIYKQPSYFYKCLGLFHR